VQVFLEAWLVAWVTFYCPCFKCCKANSPEVGGHGLTASGRLPKAGRTVAADWKVWPKGTCLEIEGIGIRRVEDRGSKIRGQALDVFMATHEKALKPRTGTRKVRLAKGGC